MADSPKTEEVIVFCLSCGHRWTMGLWYWNNIWEKGLWSRITCKECGSSMVTRQEMDGDEK